RPDRNPPRLRLSRLRRGLSATEQSYSRRRRLAKIALIVVASTVVLTGLGLT
ncbi:MAG: hypothetical protein ACJAVS_002298, partial [Paracoccaceae bacterium]